ncbi:chemotaxis protein CheW [Romboutsia sedimentorum]|uniref:Chemotaxis protein CheW n=1 Tax=Romboutsia sedimentorum TaxID=1368474 RepID=A0ABT7E6U5_9FIRM|nr:chemotaxis protein CheW [Romboutsia sedimentorum]MDK2562653.1 chemotaxis protein CheW [Romboutsia sedimentorum]MDK2585863.1 chemotaxis protein CheW [Romboutsia sedimentorum]
MNTDDEIIENKIDDLYMVFVINNQKYALSSKYIIEIIEMLPITKVPFLPKYMKGVINLRSTIIPVMDGRMRFDMDPIDYNERTCIIIIENNMDKIGLIVDAVNEVIHISSSQNMKISSNKDEFKQNFINGISEINNEIQLILDCDSLIEIVEDINNGTND